MEAPVEKRTSELAKAVEAAERAQLQLQNAIESIPDVFSLYDSDDRIVLDNSKYKDFLYPGRDSDQVGSTGAKFEDILRFSVDRDLVGEAKDDPETWIARRLENHRNPGVPVVQLGPFGRWLRIGERRTDDGGSVGVYTDVTELKKRKQEAEEANQAKRAFLANMGHEHRTPLDAIIDITEMLREDPAEDGRDEFANHFNGFSGPPNIC